LTARLGNNALSAEAGKRENYSAQGTLDAALDASFPALPFPLSSAPAPEFFFHWCLLTGASAEERGTSMEKKDMLNQGRQISFSSDLDAPKKLGERSCSEKQF